MALLPDVIRKMFASASPHMRLLGFELLEMEHGVAVGRLPYHRNHVGDPSTGVVHGGVVTTLLDSVGGAAVFAALGMPTTLATLDLRIDYLRPSTPNTQLYARVECYKHTRNVAFTRGFAYNGDINDPVAAMAATYMLRTQSLRMPKFGGGT